MLEHVEGALDGEEAVRLLLLPQPCATRACVSTRESERGRYGSSFSRSDECVCEYVCVRACVRERGREGDRWG